MERIRIALLQIAPCAAPEGGLQKGLEYCARAKELGAYPRNTMILFDRHGREKLRYAKVHTCDLGAEKDLTPGECVISMTEKTK